MNFNALKDLIIILLLLCLLVIIVIYNNPSEEIAQGIKTACTSLGVIGSFASILGIGMTSIISFIVGNAINTTKIPYRRLWNLNAKDIDNLYIFMSSRREGKYNNNLPINENIPTVGIGQVKTLNLILHSVNQGYKQNIDNNNLIISEENVKNLDSKNLVLLGSPVTNRYTNKIINKAVNLDIETQKSYYSLNFHNKKWQIMENDQENDYAIIIYTKIFFDLNQKKNMYVLFGLHTYGTIAAAKYFMNDFYKDFIQNFYIKNASIIFQNLLILLFNFFIKIINSLKSINKNKYIKYYSLKKYKAIRWRNIIAVIRCEIYNQSPTNIKLVDFDSFPTKKMDQFFR